MSLGPDDLDAIRAVVREELAAALQAIAAGFYMPKLEDVPQALARAAERYLAAAADASVERS